VVRFQQASIGVTVCHGFSFSCSSKETFRASALVQCI